MRCVTILTAPACFEIAARPGLDAMGKRQEQQRKYQKNILHHFLQRKFIIEV